MKIFPFFISKRKLKLEIERMSRRIYDLEERLCPCGSHDWRQIGTRYVYNGVSADGIYKYKCAKCGKIFETWQPFLQKRSENNDFGKVASR